jgi:hypothetical protein
MKKMLLVLALFSLVASGLLASEARIDGLGLGNAAWMVQDDFLAYKYFPQMVSQYPDLAVGEMTTVSSNGYINLPFSSGVVGLLANMPTFSLIAPNINGSGAIYSMGNMGFGLSYGSANSKTLDGAVVNNTDGSYTSNHSYNIGVFGGYTFDIKKNMPVDIGLDINIPSNYTHDDVTKDNTGATTAIGQTGTNGVEINLNGRTALPNDMLGYVNLGFTQENTLVLAKTFTGGTLTTHTEESTGDSIINIALGGSKTIKAGGFNIYLGVQPSFNMNNSLESNQNKLTGANLAGNGNSTDINTINLPVFAGVEGKINDTWTVRGGVNKAVWGITSTTTVVKAANGNVTTNTTVDSTTSDAPVMALGITGVFGGITIDADVNTAMLTNGPYFLTGEQTPNFISEIAITYGWK